MKKAKPKHASLYASPPDPTAPDDGVVSNYEHDKRDSLQLGAQENADLCAGCARCCETVSIEIDAPRSAWEYDQWVWVLHHDTLEVYVEKPERWFLHIETRCTKLDLHGRCSIHGKHPILCREYDPRVCERRLPLADIAAWFKTADALEGWLQDHRPSHWKKLLAWRRKKIGKLARSSPKLPVVALIQIAEASAASHEPATHLPVRKAPAKVARKGAGSHARKRA